MYDLDENGERIRLPSGNWKSHKEDTVDWNDQKYAEIWRQGWADTVNRYLEAEGRPERLDLRSYERQGLDVIPTVHMGPAVVQMERRGIQTNIGNLNRDIKAANQYHSPHSGQRAVYMGRVFAGEREHQPRKLDKRTEQPARKMNLLIDIQQKLAAGKSTGYVRWAKVFNLKQMSKALLFLQENGIESLDQLNGKTAAIVQQTEGLRDSIRADESRLAEIAVLRGHILNYVKTRDIYHAYKASGFSKGYFETHRQALTLHKAAKDAFNERNLKKLPRIRELNAEYAQLLERKKKNYTEYRQQKAQMQDWLMAQKIVSVMLDEKEQKETEIKRQGERKTPEHGQ